MPLMQLIFFHLKLSDSTFRRARSFEIYIKIHSRQCQERLGSVKNQAQVYWASLLAQFICPAYWPNLLAQFIDEQSSIR